MPEVALVLAAVVTAAGLLAGIFLRGRISTADQVMTTLLELRRQDQDRADRLEARIRELEKLAASKDKENEQLKRQLEKVESENLSMREEMGALKKENEYLSRRVHELEARA